MSRHRRIQTERLEDRRLLAISAELLKDINTGPLNSDPYPMVEVNGTVFFAATTAASGRELWKSNGTAAGTVMVANISPGCLLNVSGTLFFSAFDSASSSELWKSDGTAAGTVRVADIFPGAESSYPGYLTNVNGTLFFRARDAAHGVELWKSDGTAGGTVQVRDIRTGEDGSSPGALTNVDGTVFFSANNGTSGYELWKSDGSFAGTVLLRDINTIDAAGGGPRWLTNVGATLFFTAVNPNGFRELWKSDGTTGGTVIVPNAVIGQYASYPQNLTEVNGMLFFAASGRLWKSDGTPAGTLRVDDGSDVPGLPQSLTNINGTLFFGATADASTGEELWKSDGSPEGTLQIAEIRPGAEGSRPKNFAAAGDLVFFSANDGPHGVELWQTDGTAAGTKLVRDIKRGTGKGSYPSYLTNIRGNLLFSAFATDSTTGEELWRLTGLPAVLNVSGSVIYKENAVSVTLDPDATVAVPVGTTFNGGNLTVTIATNADSNDLLDIRNEGTGAGQIGVSGTNVTYGGVVIGTRAGGSGTTRLVVTFNGNATLASIRELLRNIRFKSRTDDPIPGSHHIEFVLTNSQGTPSNVGVVSAKVVAINDRPALSLSGSIGYTRDAPPIVLASGAGVTDVDSPNFAGGRLLVRIGAGDSSANRLGIGAGFTVDANNNVKLTSSGITIGKLTSSGFGTSDLIVVFNANATVFRVQQLVRAITFKTVGGAAGQRRVIFTVSDGEGGLSNEAGKTVNVS